jgi:HPt (histidine-containing phosphotransfer) domain-containing protein
VGAGGEGIQAAAHNLRGTSMTMGARRLGELAAQVEERAHRLPDSAIEHEVIAAIAEEYARVRAACLRERDSSNVE